ncbi:MAG: glycosyltransferase, partial [Candidatus Limnocylindrales bacterium]
MTAAGSSAERVRRVPVHPYVRLGPKTQDTKTSASSRRPFISVLLPVRDESEELIECLASLARQTYPRSRFEILVADGSDTPIDPVIFPVGLDVKVYPNKARLMSPGLNMIARQARGERLAIV